MIFNNDIPIYLQIVDIITNEISSQYITFIKQLIPIDYNENVSWNNKNVISCKTMVDKICQRS